MAGTVFSFGQRIARLCLAAAIAVAVLLPPSTVSVSAAGDERTLYLHHTHTGETATFTFKRNGRYDQKVLNALNVFLADWRTKEPTKMDPALFDLMWQVYREVGGRQPINIVSSYRSPKTNAMLRSKSSGVAENSQHMKGRAIDFFIPGVQLTLLREVAMRHQVGGVGYYPTSGSPFVHLDTGSVRAWPRMTRAQLKKVFPDGRTLHIPTDGKPLSAEGYRYAELEWSKCRSVPCNGASMSSSDIVTASLGGDAPVPADRPNLLDFFFGGDKEPTPETEMAVASLTEPTQRTVEAIEIVAPIPAVRTNRGLFTDDAPVPAIKSARLVAATKGTGLNEETALSAVAALGESAPIPESRLVGRIDPAIVTAYVPADPEPGAELALRMIIEGSAIVPDADALITASVNGGPGADVNGVFEGTFETLATAAVDDVMAMALADFAADLTTNESISARGVELVPPEWDHVNETMVHPVLMSEGHFAVMTEAEGYLDKQTELGPLSGHVGFLPEPEEPLVFDRFLAAPPPLLVAAR